MIKCTVDIPFDLRLTKSEAVLLEGRLHDALEDILSNYWRDEETFELKFDETFEELLERRLREKHA
jgi:hypothetical protein